MTGAVVVAAARSPITPARTGGLAGTRADTLAAQVAAAALAQVPGLPRHALEDLYLGCALPGGEQGFNMARVVAVLLGMDHLPGATVTRYCASSLQALRMAAHAVAAGEGHAFLVVGAESSTRHRLGTSDSSPGTKNPRFAGADRTGSALPRPWSDPRDRGEVPDVYVDVNRTAEHVAGLHAIGRGQQDDHAVRSHRRALTAIANGWFDDEIVPVRTDAGEWVAADECPRPDTSAAALARLTPLFPGGTVTAGNSCRLADGAAALVVTSRPAARRYGLPVRAHVRATALGALSPELMPLGAVDATRRAVHRAGMAVADLDLVELNEEYAAQLIVSQRLLGLEDDRVNVCGGAIALGHPYGMTGVRMVCTLLSSLRRADLAVGAVATPAGGGQGTAVVLERED